MGDENENNGTRRGQQLGETERYKDDEDDLGDADENEMTWEYAND